MIMISVRYLQAIARGVLTINFYHTKHLIVHLSLSKPKFRTIQSVLMLRVKLTSAITISEKTLVKFSVK